jgi:NNP family nitrate/nitrite transporter-like MFS transporter
MNNLEGVTKGQQHGVLGMSTFAFTVCFAVWTIFSIIGIKIKQNLGLSDTQFGILVATPILTGSISRIFLGIWTDQYGGRRVFTAVMMLTSIAVWLLSTVETYEMFLVAALGVGFAGGSFAVGIAYVSSWYQQERQGTALGIFGMGNVGAAVTTFAAPYLVIEYGWEFTAQVYAVILFATAVLFFLLTKEDPAQRERKEKGIAPKSAIEQMEPLKNMQVWRFSLYYFFVFGAFVALALWLPRYAMGVYGLGLKEAGLIAASYALPGSIFRALGGWMSDKYGARAVMYWTFIASTAICFILSYPPTTYQVAGVTGMIEFNLTLPLSFFVVLVVLLGFFMSLGKAAVYKHIPVYYPNNVGAVGGMVGMIGGLGGFTLPIAFGFMNDYIGVWTSSFMLLTVLVGGALIWMHLAVRRMERAQIPELKDLPAFPEMEEIHTDEHAGKLR